MIKKIFIFSIIFCLAYNNNLSAKKLGKYTGLEIPRFVASKAFELNLRVGPSTSYPIIIRYTSKNIPLKIIEEYKNWRKVEDFNNNTGWVLKSLIKGNRFALIKPPYDEPAQVYNKPKGNLIGKIGNKNIVRLNKCLLKWCHISFEEHKGWINKSNLWGVFEREIFNKPFYQPLIEIFWKFDL